MFVLLDLLFTTRLQAKKARGSNPPASIQRHLKFDTEDPTEDRHPFSDVSAIDDGGSGRPSRPGSLSRVSRFSNIYVIILIFAL